MSSETKLGPVAPSFKKPKTNEEKEEGEQTKKLPDVLYALITTFFNVDELTPLAASCRRFQRVIQKSLGQLRNVHIHSLTSLLDKHAFLRNALLKNQYIEKLLLSPSPPHSSQNASKKREEFSRRNQTFLAILIGHSQAVFEFLSGCQWGVCLELFEELVQCPRLRRLPRFRLLQHEDEMASEILYERNASIGGRFETAMQRAAKTCKKLTRFESNTILREGDYPHHHLDLLASSTKHFLQHNTSQLKRLVLHLDKKHLDILQSFLTDSVRSKFLTSLSVTVAGRRLTEDELKSFWQLVEGVQSKLKDLRLNASLLFPTNSQTSLYFPRVECLVLNQTFRRADQEGAQVKLVCPELKYLTCGGYNVSTQGVTQIISSLTCPQKLHYLHVRVPDYRNLYGGGTKEIPNLTKMTSLQHLYLDKRFPMFLHTTPTDFVSACPLLASLCCFSNNTTSNDILLLLRHLKHLEMLNVDTISAVEMPTEMDQKAFKKERQIEKKEEEEKGRMVLSNLKHLSLSIGWDNLDMFDQFQMPNLVSLTLERGFGSQDQKEYQKEYQKEGETINAFFKGIPKRQLALYLSSEFADILLQSGWSQQCDAVYNLSLRAPLALNPNTNADVVWLAQQASKIVLGDLDVPQFISKFGKNNPLDYFPNLKHLKFLRTSLSLAPKQSVQRMNELLAVLPRVVSFAFEASEFDKFSKEGIDQFLAMEKMRRRMETRQSFCSHFSRSMVVFSPP
jgi:hypothetical protein